MTARVEPAMDGLDEREMLREWLDYHRETLLLKCDGLTPEQLGERAVAPSTITLQGLIRHMTEVERNWFLRVFAGETAPPIYYSDDDPDGDFDNLDPAKVDEEMAMFHETVERCREVESLAKSLDETGQHRRHDRRLSGPATERRSRVATVRRFLLVALVAASSTFVVVGAVTATAAVAAPPMAMTPVGLPAASPAAEPAAPAPSPPAEATPSTNEALPLTGTESKAPLRFSSVLLVLGGASVLAAGELRWRSRRRPVSRNAG
jgi:hypothetical protein